MKKFNQLLVAAGVFAIASSAQATLINFQSAADGYLGESAWSTINISSQLGDSAPYSADIDITATNGEYVYFDANTAGMGACGEIGVAGSSDNPDSKVINTRYFGDDTNMCAPGSDDNLHGDESLLFTFNELTDLNGIWFNNNHDAVDDTLDGIQVEFIVNGTDTFLYTFAGAEQDDSLGYFVDFSNIDERLDSFFSAGETLEIGHPVTDQVHNFYISAIDVPEPAIVALLGLGLAGIGFARRGRK